MWVTLPAVMRQWFIDELHANGPQALMARIEKTFCPGHELYSMSKDWAYIPNLILKCKGAKGDVIISFDGTMPSR